MSTIDTIKAKLIAEGYGGLYYPGECACDISELAACGNCEQQEGEDYINDCEPGHKHFDPTRPDFWVISANKEPPPQERFDALFAEFG